MRRGSVRALLVFVVLPLGLLVFARVDVKDVRYVIVSFHSILSSVRFADGYTLQNYDFPNNCEDYIHRIGRTGVSI